MEKKSKKVMEGPEQRWWKPKSVIAQMFLLYVNARRRMCGNAVDHLLYVAYKLFFFIIFFFNQLPSVVAIPRLMYVMTDI